MKVSAMALAFSLAFFGISANNAFALVETPSKTTTPATASDLTKRYYNTAKDCGSDSKPAFLCSGVIFRGTQHSNQYKFWQPSPKSVQQGGVSFSYLRQDAKFQRLAYGYNNGFILYPIFGAPKERLDIEVMCAFPIDAATFERDAKGCGQNQYSPVTSRACQSQGIQSAQQWLQHYNATGVSNRHRHQCGFDVSDNSRSNTAVAFDQTLKSMKLIQAESITQQNELRLATWTEHDPARLPIEALFYINDGLKNAQLDQQDYKNATGKFLPIIKMTLPRSVNEEATFHFVKTDQVVQP
ncbi:hypothetical protein [Serratia odorifera]|jgi:hypothetical protein|uniref:Halovibrin n=2 Tax=Serratia odorifera TaxID=618 RepID=D4DYW1_SEROD|nr:hypothetical protein [Serratia odorifera]EFE97283.1 hypothetical protein HMPREF0758_1111 [Serratia odorifera DSM 4582]VDZ54594.1 Uncharacterised protein [Serratia odorifera]